MSHFVDLVNNAITEISAEKIYGKNFYTQKLTSIRGSANTALRPIGPHINLVCQTITPNEYEIYIENAKGGTIFQSPRATLFVRSAHKIAISYPHESEIEELSHTFTEAEFDAIFAKLFSDMLQSVLRASL
mgnify:CR=1 FL=1